MSVLPWLLLTLRMPLCLTTCIFCSVSGSMVLQKGCAAVQAGTLQWSVVSTLLEIAVGLLTF